MKQAFLALLVIIFPAFVYADTDIAVSHITKKPTGYELHVSPNQTQVIHALTSATGWTALGNDTTGLSTDLDAPIGGGSVEFDKVNGAANTVFAGVYRTLSSLDFSGYGLEGRFQWAVRLAAVEADNVSYAFLRLGTSVSHYTEWRVPVAQLKDGWQVVSVPIGMPASAGLVGNGWNIADVDYISIGIAFEAENDTSADIRLNTLTVSSVPSIVAGLNDEALAFAHGNGSTYNAGDVGAAMMTVRADTPATSATAGQYAFPITDANGRLWTNASITSYGFSTEATFAAQASITAATLDNTYRTVSDLADETKQVIVDNQTNGDVQLSFDGGVSDTFLVKAGDVLKLNLTSLGLITTATVQAKDGTAVATTGSVYVYAIK